MAEQKKENEFHAVLCGSDAASLRASAGLLRSLLQERGVPFSLAPLTDAAALRETAGDCDLLLLGVTLGGEDGIALAETLRARGWRGCLGFVSDSPARAFEAFRAAPADYLLRPVTRASLARLLDRALPRAARTALSVETERGLRRIDAAELAYVEVSDRTLGLHLKSGVVTASGSLTALQARLPPERFFRCHKSYLVNLDDVLAVRRYRAQLRDGTAIPVGKARYLALRGAFEAHLRGDA